MTRIAERPQSPIWEDDLVVLSVTCSCLHTECKDLSQTLYASSLSIKKCTSKTDGKHVPPMRPFLYLKTDEVKALSQDSHNFPKGTLPGSRRLQGFYNTQLWHFQQYNTITGEGMAVSSLFGRHPNFLYFQYMKLLWVCNFEYWQGSK